MLCVSQYRLRTALVFALHTSPIDHTRGQINHALIKVREMDAYHGIHAASSGYNWKIF